MKKIFNKILVAVSFLAVAVGCSVKDIDFSHETASFAVKDNLILIEAIAPLGLTATDAVYIAGPALGDSAAVVSSTRYQMEQASDMNRKWGVYLDPTEFKDGKTLADGFYFVVVDKGLERTPLNKEPEHSISNATVGNVYTVYMAGAWSNDFLVQELVDIPVHKNFRIYIEDKTGWDEIALYMYSYDGKGVDNLYGGWPGIAPAGTIELGGKEWTYFEIGPAANGLSENVIFNNNGNGVQTGDDPHITFDVADFFFTVTAEKATLLPNLGIDRKPELEEQEPEPEDGPKLYIKNSTTWGASTFAHYWGNSSTEWPGKELTDYVTIDGTEFTVLSTLRGNRGTEIGIIFHPNVADESVRVTVESLLLDTDRYYELTDTGLTELNMGTRVWVKNESYWPGKLYGHFWFDKEGTTISTEWPGIQSIPGYFLGEEYEVMLVPTSFSGQKEVNAIFHSDENDEVFRAQTMLNLEEDAFVRLDANYDVVNEDVAPKRVTFFVDDQTGWDAIALYMWGDVNDLGGGWPGLQVCGTVSVDGIDYKVFIVENADGLNENLIFNNNNNGIELASFPLTLDKTEFYFTVTDSGVTLKDPSQSAVFFVNDQTGWTEGLALYMWGEAEAAGGWPGAVAPASTVKVGNVDAKVLVVNNVIGKKENLIFNNANNGKQFDAFNDFTVSQGTYFFKVSDGTVKLF